MTVGVIEGADAGITVAVLLDVCWVGSGGNMVFVGDSAVSRALEGEGVRESGLSATPQADTTKKDNTKKINQKYRDKILSFFALQLSFLQ